MHSVVVGQDHNGQQITNADLTTIPPTLLHPDVLSREVSVLDALADVDTTTVAPLAGDALVWDGVSWAPKAVSANSYYREAFTVGTVPSVLTVVHNLAVDVVSVTVIRRGSPNVVVTPTVSALDVNTVEVAIEGGPTGTYEVLVLSEGGTLGSSVPAHTHSEYLPLVGGTLTGTVTVTDPAVLQVRDAYGAGVSTAFERPILEEFGSGGGNVGVGIIATGNALSPSTLQRGIKINLGSGNYGYMELLHSVHGSPPALHVAGDLSAADVVDRSVTATKADVADLSAADSTAVLSNLRPITYRRVFADDELLDRTEPSPPFRRVGFAVEDVEACGLDGLVRGEGDERGYSIPGLLAVAIGEIKRLSAEVEALKKTRKTKG